MTPGEDKLSDKQRERKRKREQMQEAKKEHAIAEKNSRTLVTYASKAISSVEPLLKRLQASDKSIEKVRHLMEDMTVQNLGEHLDWAKNTLEEAHKIMKAVGNGGLAK